MPVYHFTYHAFGTWLPDHGRGYTRRGAQVLPPDNEMADRYRANMSQPPVRFTSEVQRVMIAELQTACEAQGYTLHSVGTDDTHLHVVVAWDCSRHWKRVRADSVVVVAETQRDVRQTQVVCRAAEPQARARSRAPGLSGGGVPPRASWLEVESAAGVVLLNDRADVVGGLLSSNSPPATRARSAVVTHRLQSRDAR